LKVKGVRTLIPRTKREEGRDSSFISLHFNFAGEGEGKTSLFLDRNREGECFFWGGGMLYEAMGYFRQGRS